MNLVKILFLIYLCGFFAVPDLYAQSNGVAYLTTVTQGVSGSSSILNFTGNQGGPNVATSGGTELFWVGQFSGAGDLDPGPGVYGLTSGGSFDGILSYYSLNFPNIFVGSLRVGGTGFERINSIALGGNLDIVYGGHWGSNLIGIGNYTVDFNPLSSSYGFNFGSVPSIQNFSSVDDFFITKLSTTLPGVHAWSISVGNTDSESVRDLALDSNGHVYATGHFSNFVDFDPSPAVSNLQSGFANNQDHPFIASYASADGSLRWARTFAGYLDDYGASISVDSQDNIVASGLLSAPTTFNINISPGGGSVSCPCYGFVTKLSSGGTYQWFKVLPGRVLASAVDSSDNIYLIGFFTGTGDFNPDPSPGAIFNMTPVGNSDVFVMKLDSSGVFQWATQLGGTGQDSVQPFYYSYPTYPSELLTDLTVNNCGQIEIVGTFTGSFDIDTGPGTQMVTSANAGSDRSALYLVMNAAGGYVGHGVYGDGPSGVLSSAIKLSKFTNSITLLTSIFSGTVDFNPTSAVNNFVTGFPNEAYLNVVANQSCF